MTPSQVLQKRMEEFEEKFLIDFFSSEDWKYDYNRYPSEVEFTIWQSKATENANNRKEKIKYFSLTTSLALIESFEEIVESKRLKPDEENPLDLDREELSYNQALDDLRTLLREEKEKIKKMI